MRPVPQPGEADFPQSVHFWSVSLILNVLVLSAIIAILCQAVGVGWWIVAPIAVSAPHLIASVVKLLRLRRSQRVLSRRVKGLCRRCGYDLRASSARCPECGTVVCEEGTCT